MITGKNYIGNLLASTGKVTFKTFNPQENKENDVVFFEASEAEIEVAVALASEAFTEFRHISGVKKSEFLNQIANEIEALDDVLIKIYCLESSCAPLPIW